MRCWYRGHSYKACHCSRYDDVHCRKCQLFCWRSDIKEKDMNKWWVKRNINRA